MYFQIGLIKVIIPFDTIREELYFEGYERFFIRRFGFATFTATLNLVSSVGLP